MNESQRNAVEQSLGSRLNLSKGRQELAKTFWQFIYAVNIWQGPILACAESNVAVDNLLEGLIDIGVKAVYWQTGKGKKPTKAAL